MKYTFRFLFINLIFLNVSVFANTIKEERFWGNFNLNGSLFNSKKWQYDFNIQSRYNFSIGQYENTRSEGGIGYKSSKNISLWLGGTTILRHDNRIEEYRPWQQVQWHILNSEQIRLSSRTRLEERKEPNFSEWAYRLRQRFSLSFPKKLPFNITPILANEIFFNLNNPQWINSNGSINQNRAFIGIEIPLHKNISFETGYLNQYEFRNEANRLNHVLYVNLKIKT